MSDGKASQVIVLCEDIQQRVFVYRYLTRLGYGPRDVKFDIAPAGQGAGDAYVLGEYARQANECRTRNKIARTVFIAVVDVDTLDLEERRKQLDGALSAGGAHARTNVAPIVTLLPKRNIETWIRALFGEAVNEVIKFSRFDGRERDCFPAVDILFQMRRSDREPANDWPPSLKLGYSELSSLHAKPP